MKIEEIEAEAYAEKECKNCTYRCDKPGMFKRLSDKKECYAYFRSYEAYIAGFKDALKIKVNTTTLSDAPFEDKRKLEEAKEIIEDLLTSSFSYNSKMVNYEVKAKAEAFLKEIEK